jgi:hypothetical protein
MGEDAGGMYETLNPPRLQWVLVVWGGICLFGVLLGVKLMFEYPVGTDGWQASIFLVAICVAGWIGIAAIVWFEQRQLAFVPEALLVRRWTDVVFGRPGKRIALRGALSARMFVGSYGYSAAKIEVGGETLMFPLSFWPRSDAQRLAEVLERHGMTVEIGGSVFDGEG